MIVEVLLKDLLLHDFMALRFEEVLDLRVTEQAIGPG
jgi:hypothetical protein